MYETGEEDEPLPDEPIEDIILAVGKYCFGMSQRLAKGEPGPTAECLGYDRMRSIAVAPLATSAKERDHLNRGCVFCEKGITMMRRSGTLKPVSFRAGRRYRR